MVCFSRRMIVLLPSERHLMCSFIAQVTAGERKSGATSEKYAVFEIKWGSF